MCDDIPVRYLLAVEAAMALMRELQRDGLIAVKHGCARNLDDALALLPGVSDEHADVQ